jgi:hypothetical protein
MHFMFVKIMDIRYKEDVVLALQSEGIHRASYIESKDLQKSLSDDFKLFTGFFAGDPEENQVIITALIDDPGQAEGVIRNLTQAGIDVTRDPILRIILWPVTHVFDGPEGWLEHPDTSQGGSATR